MTPFLLALALAAAPLSAPPLEPPTIAEQAQQTHPGARARLMEEVAERQLRVAELSVKLPSQQVAADAGRMRLAAQRAAEAAAIEAQRVAALEVAAREAERTRVVRPATGQVTSNYGMRVHPITGVYKLHSGTDFSVGDGNAYAAMAGRVSISYPAWAGILVTVDHGDGVVTQYGHLQRETVEPGQWVAAGDRVGIIGARGYATGRHLHWEVIRRGRYIDPLEWLAENGVSR